MPFAAVSPNLRLTGHLALLLLLSAGWTWAFLRLSKKKPLIPAEPFPRIPWGFGSVLLVLLLSLALQVAFALVLQPFVTIDRAQLASAAKTPAEWFLIEQIVVSALFNASMIVLIPLVLRATSGATLREVGLTRRPLARDVLYGVLAYPLVVPFLVLIHRMFSLRVWNEQKHPIELMLRDDSSPAIVVLAIVSGVILAPVGEELLFRGVLQGWLTGVWMRKTASEPVTAGSEPSDPAIPDAPARSHLWAPIMPNVIASFVFAGMHWGQWPAPLALFVLSMALGYLYQKTGRLTASIVLHALFNGVSTATLLAGLAS